MSQGESIFQTPVKYINRPDLVSICARIMKDKWVALNGLQKDEIAVADRLIPPILNFIVASRKLSYLLVS